MLEISHMNVPEPGDAWSVNDILMLVVLENSDDGICVSTQLKSTKKKEWDLTYTQLLSLPEFRSKLGHNSEDKNLPLAKVSPGIYADVAKQFIASRTPSKVG